jgi:outer membrane protein insertion porin family
MKKFFLLPFFLGLICCVYFPLRAQDLDTSNVVISYTSPEEFTIGGISITGAKFLDASALISLTNLKVGDKITVPGEQLTNAMKKLWDQGLIGDIQVLAKQTVGKVIYITFVLKERPRLSRFTYKGVKKGDIDDLNEKVDITRGRIVNDALLKNAKKKIRNYYVEKGFLNTVVNITPEKDSLLSNNVILRVQVDKKKKVKIDNIIITGDNSVTRKKLEKETMKKKGTPADTMPVADPVHAPQKHKTSFLAFLTGSDNITEAKLKRQMKKTKQNLLKKNMIKTKQASSISTIPMVTVMLPLFSILSFIKMTSSSTSF